MIYLVEDDDNIRELVVYTLNTVGFQAKGFAEAKEFEKSLQAEKPELILLDIMLPDKDGLTILSELKKNAATARIPVIMLTAKASEIDKVRGFEMGADDYIPKPFGMMELVARVKARLRGSQGQNSDRQEYRIGTLCVSPTGRWVKLQGQEISLTKKEFDILCLLLQNEDAVLTRDQLLNRVWGYSFDGESRTVDVHIRTLRQKLGDYGELIETVRGIGYRIATPTKELGKFDEK